MTLEYWYPEPGTEHNEQRLREQLNLMGYRVSRYVYPPGTYFPDHDHAFSKIEVVLSGRFQMGMSGTTVILEPGQALHVPKGVLHNAEVVGDQPVVSLDAIKIGG